MADSYAVFMEGIDFDSADLNRQIIIAARQAINRTSDRARARSAREMLRQVNFPSSYVRGSNSRLTVRKRASDADLESVISGRRRATSLARFVSGTGQSRAGVMVQVKPGRTQLVRRAFLMKLRSGDGGALGNVGLAVRAPRGQRPKGAYKPVRLGDDLWLLYGPSIDQVFKSVRKDVSPDAGAFLSAEFSRLLELKP